MSSQCSSDLASKSQRTMRKSSARGSALSSLEARRVSVRGEYLSCPFCQGDGIAEPQRCIFLLHATGSPFDSLTQELLYGSLVGTSKRVSAKRSQVCREDNTDLS